MLTNLQVDLILGTSHHHTVDYDSDGKAWSRLTLRPGKRPGLRDKLAAQFYLTFHRPHTFTDEVEVQWTCLRNYELDELRDAFSFAVNDSEDIFAIPTRSTDPFDLEVLARIEDARHFNNLVDIWRLWHAHNVAQTNERCNA